MRQTAQAGCNRNSERALAKLPDRNDLYSRTNSLFLVRSGIDRPYTLVAATGRLDPSFNSAETLLQDLTAIRIWIVIGGLAVYSGLLASKAPTAMTLAALSALAWVMFIEDYMVLDSVLFVAAHPLAQVAVIMRPLFLVGLTYICFKHFESEVT